MLEDELGQRGIRFTVNRHLVDEGQCALHVEPEQDDIAILHDIFFAF